MCQPVNNIMQWNIEDIIVIVIEPLEINQLSTLNNQQGIDLLLNK